MDSANASAVDTPTLKPKWADYYEAVSGRPPRETLLLALNRFEVEPGASPRATAGFALDLGCGDGRDTVELLRRNWRVLAIDGEPKAIARLRQRRDIDRSHLETRVQRFEHLTLPPDVDLINASFCLPFCPPNHFQELWEEIVMALRTGGRLCGHLFGDRDSWAGYANLNFHTRQKIDQLFLPFEIEMLNEEKHSGKTALGEEKYWHIYNFVARRL